MKFEKGHIKKAGRPSGGLNKKTLASKELVQDMVKDGKKEFKKRWYKLNDKDFTDVWIKLLEYNIPKMARIENENKMPTSITVNMIAATPEKIEQQNTIDITHEEIND